MPRPKRATRQTELGLEILCCRCGEFWPVDQEFFYFNRGQPHSWCKACMFGSECFKAKRARWLAKTRVTPLPALPAPQAAAISPATVELLRAAWSQPVGAAP